MKKIFAVLFLITLTTVAFTSQASANFLNHTEYLVSDFSPDIVIVAISEAPSEVYCLTEIGTIVSKEVDIPDIGTSVNAINSVNYAKVHFPYEVGLTNIKLYNSDIKSTSHAQIYLPYEVGLTNNNI